MAKMMVDDRIGALQAWDRVVQGCATRIVETASPACLRALLSALLPGSEITELKVVTLAS